MTKGTIFTNFFPDRLGIFSLNSGLKMFYKKVDLNSFALHLIFYKLNKYKFFIRSNFIRNLVLDLPKFKKLLELKSLYPFSNKQLLANLLFL